MILDWIGFRWMTWNEVRLNGMIWDEIGSDELGWLRWNWRRCGTKWIAISLERISWNEVSLNKMKSAFRCRGGGLIEQLCLLSFQRAY